MGNVDVNRYDKNTELKNSYLCNKLENVIFFVLGMGFFIEAIALCTEKIDLLRIAHMIFSTGVWTIS
jgi:hypothetical protein